MYIVFKNNIEHIGLLIKVLKPAIVKQSKTICFGDLYETPLQDIITIITRQWGKSSVKELKDTHT